MAYTDQEIYKLLKEDKEQGAAALLEAYTGLLWSVCARRLENPEDIRECVNESFAEFCMGYERFDEKKSSLKNYLCLIADRNALNRYRDNQRRAQVEGAVIEELTQKRTRGEQKKAGTSIRESMQDAPGQVTFRNIEGGELTREELEAAIEALEPVDSQIIRLKYYEGLSYQEIAEKLDLQYETVKKRGQRSLKKLWKILIIGMIILLLAACAIIVRRYFQFAEGVGFNWSEEDFIYRMVDTSQACEADGFTFSVEEAVYRDGYLYFRFGYGTDMEADTSEEWSRQQALYQAYLFNLKVKGYDVIHDGVVDRFQTMEIRCGWQPEELPDEFTLEVVLAASESATEITYGSFEEGNKTLELQGPDPVFTIRMAKVEMQEDVDAIGTIQQFEDTGFVVCPGKREMDETVFSLYSMNEGMGGGTYQISSLLVSDFRSLGKRDEEKVTLTGADGNVWENRWISGGFSWLDEVVMRFPELEPGEYTMRIPYLCLNSEQVSEAAYVQVPKASGETLSCDQVFLFPDGTGMRLTGITMEQYEPGDEIVYENGEMRETVYITYKTYRYELEWEPVSTEMLTYCSAVFSGRGIYGELPEQPAGEYFELDPMEAYEKYGASSIGGSYVGGKVFLSITGKEAQPADWIELRLQEPLHIYEKSFDIKVSIE